MTHRHFCCTVLVIQTSPSAVWKAAKYQYEHQKACLSLMQNTFTLSQGPKKSCSITASSWNTESHHLNQVWVWRSSLSTVPLNLLAGLWTKEIGSLPPTYSLTIVGKALNTCHIYPVQRGGKESIWVSVAHSSFEIQSGRYCKCFAPNSFLLHPRGFSPWFVALPSGPLTSHSEWPFLFHKL